jgi:hypothetical protein
MEKRLRSKKNAEEPGRRGMRSEMGERRRTKKK